MSIPSLYTGGPCAPVVIDQQHCPRAIVVVQNHVGLYARLVNVSGSRQRLANPAGGQNEHDVMGDSGFRAARSSVRSRKT